MTTPNHHHEGRKERRDKGSRRSDWDTRPCQVCAAPVTRRISDFRERVYCSRDCFHADVSTIASAKREAGESWGRSAGEHARPFLCSDGQERASSLRPDGYRHVHWAQHPDANRAGRITEHRLVMEQVLGRRLLPTEQVHHRNGVRDDNDPSNLELWLRQQPPGQRADEIVDWCRAQLGLYGTDDERARYGDPVT